MAKGEQLSEKRPISHAIRTYRQSDQDISEAPPELEILLYPLDLPEHRDYRKEASARFDLADYLMFARRLTDCRPEGPLLCHLLRVSGCHTRPAPLEQ